MRKSLLVVSLVSLIVSSMACSMAAVESSYGGGPVSPVPSTSAVLLPPTAAPTESPTESPATSSDVCPIASEGTELYVNEQNGYCFLYPSVFKVDDVDQVFVDVSFVGDPAEGDTSMEPLIAWLSVNTVGRPGMAVGLSLENYVHGEVVSLGDYANEVTTEPATIGGAEAIIATGPLGRMDSRQAYILANDTLYVLHNDPLETDVPEIQSGSDLLWNTVIGSMAFFDVPDVPVVTADEVCPVAAAGQTLYTDLAKGFCFLVPDTFSGDENWPGVFAGGPEIPNMPDFIFPENQVSVTVGFNGPADGRTVDQIAQEWVEVNPTIWIVEQGATIGNHPAVVMLDSTENLGLRVALVEVDELTYSILVKPTNDAAYPGCQPAADDLWALVTDSIRFFEPWN